MREGRRKDPSLLDRLLRLFTEVRAGEGLTALLLLINVFLILGAYYFIKPVREALILSESGAEVKSYAAAGQAVLLLGLVPLYGRLASRFPRKPLINVVTFFFAGCLVAFWALAQADVSIGIAFYLWVGIFNVMIVAQFWSFANDVYTKEEGERLFAIVAFGAAAGAVVGTWFSGEVIGLFGVSGAMIGGAVLLSSSLALTNWVDARKGVGTDSGGGDRDPDESGGKDRDEDPSSRPLADIGAFKLLLDKKYLLLIAFLILLLNWVNTTGEYILGRVVEERALEMFQDENQAMQSWIGQFYSRFYFWVNVIELGIQAFLVSRIIKHLSVRWALLILPVLAFGAYTLMIFYPVLGVIRWAKTLENATDYSLQNTLRHALFLPTTREEKYKAKQATDTIFWRAGDVLSAVLVFVGAEILAFSTANFALANAALVLGFFFVSWKVGAGYRRRAEEMGVDVEEAAAAAAH